MRHTWGIYPPFLDFYFGCSLSCESAELRLASVVHSRSNASIVNVPAPSGLYNALTSLAVFPTLLHAWVFILARIQSLVYSTSCALVVYS
jgi:hypothetical protein